MRPRASQCGGGSTPRKSARALPSASRARALAYGVLHPSAFDTMAARPLEHGQWFGRQGAESACRRRSRSGARRHGRLGSGALPVGGRRRRATDEAHVCDLHGTDPHQSRSCSTTRMRPCDVMTDSEDHAGDKWRYACMSRPWVPMKEAPKPENSSTPSPSGWTRSRRLADVLSFLSGGNDLLPSAARGGPPEATQHQQRRIFLRNLAFSQTNAGHGFSMR